MSQLKKYLDLVLNVSTIAMLLVLSVFLVKRLVTKDIPRQSLKLGTPFVLPGADWKAHPVNLVMVLQVGCHWCEASAGMYQDIIKANSDGHVHMLAVLPQKPSESKQFLANLQIPISEVYQAPMAPLGVDGTPTLIIVDNAGRVQSTWIGQLSPDHEKDLFKALNLTEKNTESSQLNSPDRLNASSRHFGLITARQLKNLVDNRTPLTVLDVDPRSDFKKLHIDGAINIPIEELENRAIHEIPQSEITVVYCKYRVSCRSDTTGEIMQTYCPIDTTVKTYCGLGLDVLEQDGYHQIRVFNDDLIKMNQDSKVAKNTSTRPGNIVQF